MYTIIGGDGKEYGPVSADQIRAWLAAGRANLETKAKAIGSAEWKPLVDYPEFNGSLPGTPVPGIAPTSSDAQAIAQILIARAPKLDIGSCYERSWNLLKGDFWPIVGVTTLISIIEGLLIGPSFATTGAVLHWGSNGLSLLFGGVFQGGLFLYFLHKIRGQTATIEDAFSGFSLALGSLVAASIVGGLLVGIGFLVFLIPGIYLAIAYMFNYALIIDQKLPFWTAMEVSRKVITAQWWRLFGLALLAIPFAILGLVCFIVGVFVASALITGAIVYAYEDLCRPPPQL